MPTGLVCSFYSCSFSSFSLSFLPINSKIDICKVFHATPQKHKLYVPQQRAGVGRCELKVTGLLS